SPMITASASVSGERLAANVLTFHPRDRSPDVACSIGRKRQELESRSRLAVRAGIDAVADHRLESDVEHPGNPQPAACQYVALAHGGQVLTGLAQQAAERQVAHFSGPGRAGIQHRIEESVVLQERHAEKSAKLLAIQLFRQAQQTI